LSTYYDIISKRSRGLWPATIRGGLKVISAGYAAITASRNLYYDRLARPGRLTRPCISVGNLTVGGTGKTPMVAWLARELDARGARVAILSRGYKGRNDGNDEQRLLQQACPRAVCLSDPDRLRAGRAAIDVHGCDILLLDDGFQHRRLARDLNVLLVDALCPDGYGHVLPRGLLREGFDGLRRADVIVLTHISQVPAAGVAELRSRCRQYSPAPILGCDHRARRLVDVAGRSHELALLEGRTLLAFAGIGNPDAFHGTLGQLGARPAHMLRFPDHHAYTVEDCRHIRDTAMMLGAEALVTTEKDMIKIMSLNMTWPCPLWAVGVEIDFAGEGGRILAQHAAALLHGGRVAS
jgi:tetraacyldisaccharide 4'-kinase